MIQTQKQENKNLSKVVIETTNLSKHYNGGSIKALDGLNLEIYEGETFGLLGPNGAGKTTTVRILNTLIKPTIGDASISGFDIKKDKDRVKKITGLLSENPSLYEKLSAQEFLEFFGSLYKIKRSTLLPRISELLKLFKIYERRDYLLESFSRGMKQKVLLASALINDPEIIFFDEPTATLDPSSARTVKNLIKELKNTKTIVICSHILPLIEELCDRIGILSRGKLVALGTINELLTQTNTSTLEDAFLKLTDGLQSSDLLSWRNNNES